MAGQHAASSTPEKSDEGKNGWYELMVGAYLERVDRVTEGICKACDVSSGVDTEALQAWGEHGEQRSLHTGVANDKLGEGGGCGPAPQVDGCSTNDTPGKRLGIPQLVWVSYSDAVDAVVDG